MQKIITDEKDLPESLVDELLLAYGHIKFELGSAITGTTKSFKNDYPNENEDAPLQSVISYTVRIDNIDNDYIVREVIQTEAFREEQI